MALALLAGTVHASQSLDRVLQLAKSEAFRSSRVDWDSVGRQARTIETKRGEDAAIRFVVAALGDPHTSYHAPEAAAATGTTAAAGTTAGATATDPRTAHAPPPQASVPIAMALPPVAGFPVVQVNRWAGRDQVGAMQTVRSTLEKALESGSCGLILDFSRNSGGNMWPMLVGLAPLATEGRLGAFRQPDGSAQRIEKVDGRIAIDGAPHFLNYRAAAVAVEAPSYVAIVIGPRSASSGEITPLMFHGQENVKFFGGKTAGFTSANRVFPLPNGGTLVLTTSMTEDRNGHAYPDGIEPDIASGQPFEDASKWLGAQCASTDTAGSRRR